MFDIVFGGIFGIMCIKNCQYVLFECMYIDVFCDDIILMEDMVEEMVVIECFQDWFCDVFGQYFQLVMIVVVQGDVECDDVFDFMVVNCVIVYCGVGYGEVVEECFGCFVWCVYEIVVFCIGEVCFEIGVCFCDFFVCNFEDQMMFEVIVKIVYLLWQMVWEQQVC